MGILNFDYFSEGKINVTEIGDSFSEHNTDTRSTKVITEASLTNIFNNQMIIMGLIRDLEVYKTQSEMYNDTKETEWKDDSMSNVNWQEKYLDNLDNNMREINENLSNTESRISEMINKHIDHSTHLDKQRHEENIELNKKIDQSMNDINTKLDSTNNWIIGLVITTIVGVVSIALASLSVIL